MTPREKMDIAAKEFEVWFYQNFPLIGANGPTEENARWVFDRVTICIAHAESKYGNTSAASRE